MTPRTLLLVGATLVAFCAPAPGQQQTDRRSRDEPEIVVEAGGRVGPCDVLRFTPDGRFLLAGGDDKVVRVWPHSATGLNLDRTHGQTLRWRAWREQRGGVKALAIAPDGKRVAIGGYGMRPSTVAVLDRATGETLALSWPRTRRGDPNFGAVMAVEFAPDGKVAFGTSDGSLWMWDPTPLKEPDRDGRTTAPPVRVGKHETIQDRDGNTEFNYPRLLHFKDKATLISVAHSGEVLACDVVNPGPDAAGQPPPTKPLFNISDGQQFSPVFRAAVSPDGNWIAAACADPWVLLRSIDGKATRRIDLPKETFARSLAWHPKTSQLAVGVSSALSGPKDGRFFADGPQEVWVFDAPTDPKAEQKKFAHPGRIEALAFHPTESHLALAGGDADEVTLVSLANPEKPLSVARGMGRRPAAVNISADGNVIGVQVQRDPKVIDPNARGTGPWARFDVKQLKPTLDATQPWVGPVRETKEWVIVPDEADRFTWHAKRLSDGRTFRLLLDRHRDLAPTCFTFLPAKDGEPTRVILGHYYGCTLFELNPAEGDTAIAGKKVFTGHAGEVTSVVAAADQSWFLTGGTDHTVAAWSLRDWKTEPGLGAVFEERGGKLVVKAVDDGSPAWEAGLRAADELDLLAVDGALVYDRRPGQKEFGTVADALAGLKAPRPRVELYFGVAGQGKLERRETLTTVRQRPMWKLFPAFDAQNRLTDWVVWMWHGSYYHTKSANGDRMAGWHVNAPAPGDRPRFYQLQQFEDKFHRPEVLEKLIETRDIGAALLLARGANQSPVPFTRFEPAPVTLALGATEVGAKGLDLTITVAPRGNNPDLLPERVELWLNDHRLDIWPKPGQVLAKGVFEQKVIIPAGKFRGGDNRIAVLSFTGSGGRAEAGESVRNPRPADDPRLLALLAGINDYSDHRKNAAGARNFGDLTSARKDATALGDSLLTYRGPKRFFPEGQVDVRLDGDAARKKLLADLNTIAKLAKPDDLLVVFFAGHGDLLMPNDGPLPKGGRAVLTAEGTFVFCCPDYSPARPGQTALTADELFTALAQVNCRKVVLIDACHSGRAAGANVVRRCVPNGQGPVIIASCDQGEESFENPKLGHGLFTYAVLESLDPNRGFRRADYNSDGVLTPEELFDYVAVRLPALVRQLGKKETQTPICFPAQLPKYALVKP